ncbi:MAG TPA: ABC transporter, partial [Micromonosporaceae bacterium]
GWLARLAGDAAARSAVIRTTLIGALRQIVVQVQALAAATDEQVGALGRLRGAVTVAYDGALDGIDDGIRDGTLLRGEVLARWQEFVGTGDLMRALQARFGRMRDAIGAAITGRPRPGRAFEHALTAGLSALIQSQIATAAEAVTTAWRADPAGAALLTEDLARSAEDVAASTDRTIRDWQRGVLDLVREQGADKRRLARVAAYTVNATGLLVMIAVFASTAFIPTGAEIGVAAGTTLAAQKLLEAMFGEDALRQLAGVAREDLLARVRVLLDADAARFMDAGAAANLDTDQPQRLRTAAHAVADLTSADPSLRSTPRPPPAAPTTDPGAR